DRQERRPEEDQERRRERDRNDQEPQSERATPRPKLERARPKALAGDGREPIGLSGESIIESQGDGHDQQQEDREGAGLAIFRQEAGVDVLVDRGRQRVQVAGRPNQERHLERLERADQRQQEHRKDNRPHQRQGYALERLPQVGARGGGRLLQRRIH